MTLQSIRNQGMASVCFYFQVHQPTRLRHYTIFDNNINYFVGMALQAQAIRRAGSAALDLAYVAAGRFDGFWELKLSPWDTSAGWLLVTEAGGWVSNLLGQAYELASPHILATNGRIHEQMIAALRSSGRYNFNSLMRQ